MAKGKSGHPGALETDQANTTEPQFANDKHGANYENDVPSDWRRGMGTGEAEGKPGFDHRKKD